MGFGWDAAREPCDDAVRAAAGQLRVALRALRAAAGPLGAPASRDAPASPDAGVHEARKALRRSRALAELLRPVAGDELAGDLVAAVRGARRRLSAARDRAVLSAALRAAWREQMGAVRPRGGRAAAAATAPLRRALLEVDGDALAAAVGRDTVAAIAADLEGARHDLRRLHDLARAAGDGPEPLAPGLRRLHRRARRAAAAAMLLGAADEQLHDARKRFKELGYVMRWWAPAWRRPIEAWLAEADALGDLIGADHDQVILRSRLRELALAPDGELLARVLAGSERRSARLRAKAFRALARLAAEPSDAFVARHVASMASARAWRLRRGDA